MRGGLHLDPDNPVHQTLQVAVDYVRFKHIDKFVKFHDHVRNLPNEERIHTWTALALAGAAVIATPVLAALASRFIAVPFQHVSYGAHSVPAPALALALLAFSIGWAYFLSGAAQGPVLLWILSALLYVYLVFLVGQGILAVGQPGGLGRSYLHAAMFSLPVVIGALTPGNRAWGNIALAIFVARFGVRVLPLPAAVLARWYYLWPVAAAMLVGAHLVLARRPWPSSLARTALASGVTLAYFLVAVLSRPLEPAATQMAGWLSTSLDQATGLLELLWFLLGASFVSGAIALALFARKAIERIFRPGILHWAIMAGWVALAVWALRAAPKGAHGPYDRYAIGILLASLAILVAWWRLKRITQEWLAGWFVASAAAVLSLRTYISMDIGGLVPGKADPRVLLGFAYAITWEVASHVRSIPLSTRWLPQPAPVLLYLGMVLIICGATLFGLTANLRYLQEELVLNEYLGALSLGLPLGLLAAAATWPVLPNGVIRRCVAAFVLTSIPAVAAFLLRAAVGPAVWPLLIAGLFVFTLILARCWPEIDQPLAGAALGCATGLGFAVLLSQHRVITDGLSNLMSMVASYSGIPGARGPAQLVWDWSVNTAWSPTDRFMFLIAAPALTMLAGVGVAATKRKPIDRGS